MSSEPREEPLPKRRKIEFASDAKPLASFSPSQRVSSRQSKSTHVKAPTNGNPQTKLSRPTSNERPRNIQKECQEVVDLTANEPDAKDVNDTGISDEKPVAASSASGSTIQSIPSPFKLLKIKDLSTKDNIDTVGIQDILGDPMLKGVWLFNYMHNIPWVMSQFDPDIRPHLQVNFVHGWKNDNPARTQMEEDAKSFPGVRSIAAYLPEMFGTHHTKMIILFRHDDTAQIIIHTANMIPVDWDLLTNSAWLSPLLPFKTPCPKPSPIGENFESALISYLLSYGKTQMGSLVTSLSQFSFSSIRAIFIGSVPGRHDVYKSKFGWPNLARELAKIPGSDKAKIFSQCSSIATFGVKDTWLSPVFFHTLSKSKNKKDISKPSFGIIWPTVKEIRESLDGYDSGSSIHLKTQSAQHQKQLEYVKPLLHRWSRAEESASRDKVAPHVKTYIRYAEGMKKIDWALLTSANISKQAWGEAPKDGKVRVCSYEAGVLVYPSLWDEKGAPQMEMKPVLEEDMPNEDGKVGMRVPYGLPPKKYEKEDEPWSRDKAHRVADRMGRYWGKPEGSGK